MKYKAIFFDRDGTLTYPNPEKKKWMYDTIESWSGKKFEMSYDKMMELFRLSAEGKTPWYRNLAEEKEHFRKYYYHMLAGESITEHLEKRANLLLDELWCNNDRLPFPEVTEVLEYFKSKGYKMGVISDTSPSLEFTLQQLDLAKYFTSFTASSLVGASKPSPIIFNAALDAQGVTAAESLYVDDYDVEADGAREQGFTSFLIDRSGENKSQWTISNLKQLVEFVEKEEKYDK